MFTILAIASFLLKASAHPVSFGSITPPTIAHDILLGRQVHCDCAGLMQRTLFDIVRGCLLTIAACVYRAIHQNIPDPNATWGQRLWVRIKITVLALFTPELMIWWAMKQWIGARAIRDKINRRYPELEWTLTHGHFVQMGGFVRKNDGSVLLLHELLLHIQNGKIDLNALRKVTKKEIDDHSKGDFLSKALVTLQTTWFVFECITRWQQKLLLTELEVVTLAFSVLNVFTYAFWWHKPLDVLCPIKLEINETPIIQPTSESQQEQDGPEEDTQNVEEALFISGGTSLSGPSQEKDATVEMGRRKISAVFSSLSTTIRDFKVALSAWASHITTASKKAYGDDGILGVFTLPIISSLNRLGRLFETQGIDKDATHVPTFYAAQLDSRDWDMVLYVCCFIGTLFGAIHFISWNSDFPTHIESILWRASSIVLVVQPLLTAWINVLENSSFADGILGYAVFLSGFVSFIFGPIAYFLARGCVLVLAFVTLHHLPSKVFETVSWTSYIPHL